MRVLVTGSSGFIGKPLILELIQLKEVKVGILLRESSPFPQFDSNVSIHYFSPNKQQNIDIFSKYTCIIHCAGVITGNSFQDYYKGNVLYTQQIVDLSYNKQFIYLSSLSACGPSHINTPKDQHSSLTPISHYGISKKIAEQIIQKTLASYTIIRPAAVLAFNETNLIALLKLIKSGFCFYGGNRNLVIHNIARQDLITIIIYALKNYQKGKNILFATNGENISQKQLMKLIKQELNKKIWFQLTIPSMIIAFIGKILTQISKQTHKNYFLNYDKAQEITYPVKNKLHWICQKDTSIPLSYTTTQKIIQELVKENI